MYVNDDTVDMSSLIVSHIDLSAVVTEMDLQSRFVDVVVGLPSSSKPKECLAPVSSVPKPTEEPIPSDRAQDLLLPEPVREILPLQPSQDHLHGSDASTVVSPSQESGKASAGNVHEPSAASTDEMQESLLCVICHEILYKCVRLESLLLAWFVMTSFMLVI